VVIHLEYRMKHEPADYKMHGLHRLRCQHAQNVDVAAVSRVISGGFGSDALTAPLTASLPPGSAIHGVPSPNALRHLAEVRPVVDPADQEA
jgi:hypothetical protein